MDGHRRQRETWKTLRRVQVDEAHNCALIGKLLESSCKPYRHATGEFFDEAVAVRGHRRNLGKVNGYYCHRIHFRMHLLHSDQRQSR